VTEDVRAVLPEIVVTATAGLVLALDLLAGRRATRWLPLVTVVGVALAAFSGPLLPERRTYFGGFVVIDSFTAFFRVTFLVLAGLAAVVAPSYLARRAVPAAEYYAGVLFSTLGAMTIALSADLITLVIGIELMSIPVYVLAGMQRRDPYSNEAALKYFLLGAFSSAVLLYGLAWLYGLAGSTLYADIAAQMSRQGLANGPTIVALALVTTGLGFKAAVVPFHQWTPDAYDGAPTPVTAFMSVAPKAAAFAAILRLMVEGLGPLSVDWSAAFAALAALTMTAGNVVALVQSNAKRMLAYSSIAHTGYILAALAAIAAGASAGAAALFYILAYGLMNLGAFACLIYLDIEGTRGAALIELNGLWRRHFAGAFAFTIFLVSLTGIPPTIGFVAKWLIIQPVLDAGLTWLAVAIALNAVLAAFYYLRVVVHMFMYDPEERAPSVIPARLLTTALSLTAAATIVFGILPNALYQWALAAAAPLIP
jgi:NADH-quinone oxidoreductase subunit N